MGKNMFSNLQLQVINVALKDFKDSHAINFNGKIYNYEAGAWIYDWVEDMNLDVSYESKKIEIDINPDDKKKLWVEANKGLLITIYDRERVKQYKDVSADDLKAYKERRKIISTKIYKTLLVQHHLNQLADNNQFVNLGLEKILK